MEQVSTSCADYLYLYKQSWLRLHEETPGLPSYEETLYSTWNISYKHIEKQNPNAVKLLQLWSYFDNNDLWYELLQDGTLTKAPWHDEIVRNKLDFDKTMRALCSHGLVNANTGESTLESQGYSVQTCVHEETMACAAMDCIASHVPSNISPKYWVLQRRLLVHADRCFVMTGPAVLRDNDLHKIGYLYDSQGRVRDAEAMYRRALEGKRRLWDQTTNRRYNLGLLYADQGKLADAEAMYRRALEGYEKALGTAVATYVPCLNTLEIYAILCESTGRLQEAVSFYGRASNGIEVVFGKNSVRYAHISNRVQKLHDSSSSILQKTPQQAVPRSMKRKRGA